MKKYQVLLALMLALLLLLSACSPKEQPDDPTDTPDEPTTQTPDGEDSAQTPEDADHAEDAEPVTFEARVLELEAGHLLTEPTQDAGQRMLGDKTRVAVTDETAIQILEEDARRDIVLSDIVVGDTVEITFFADVMETYPTQITAKSITVLERAAEDTLPLLTPVEGEWVQTSELTGERVTVEESEDAFILRALADLEKVELARVYFDAEKCDYVQRNLLWMADVWPQGSEIGVVEQTPLDGANLAISWQDEYGERERRIILPLRIKNGDTLTRSVMITGYLPPFTPVEVSAGLDSEGNGAEAAEQTENFHGLDAFGFPPTSTEIVCRYNYDLDGCGRKEAVQLLRLWDEYEQSSFALRVVKNGVNYDVGVLCGRKDGSGQETAQLPRYSAQLYLADLDEDNLVEIYFGGDMASDDYAFSVWTVDETGLSPIFIDGEVYADARIVSIEDKTMVLEKWTHVLGSYLARSAYCFDADGGLVQLDALWQIQSSAMLTLKTALPVTMPDGAKASLPAGTKLKITATDNESLAQFETASGNSGLIEITRAQDGIGWLIAGEPDSTYFETLIYAG